ncbi:translational GTPase TypA [bacterium]|nr:MAG: translational GTPase TypA [bacterium]QQR62220.1 MAG: translational GTPase TypA [bacterium]QQR63218.1 MAG: translational GTPase TypA [bacterium]
MAQERQNIRNIAIIAHVDHGKTTLVDQMLRQSGTVDVNEGERVMDSNKLEKERGITILAKHTGIHYKDTTINIVDTPGHSDFGGEVERTLQLVEGFLLLVDAAEGVLPGTRFVLQKALELKLKPIVLINKIDRKDATITETESAVHDLFLELAADASQLEFPVLYGSGRMGFVGYDKNATSGTFEPLFEAILKHISVPKAKSESLQFLVTSLDYSEFLGPIAIGRVFSGSISVGQQVVCCKDSTVSKPFKVTKLFTYVGLNKKDTETIEFGDIGQVTGFDQVPSIGTTLCLPDAINPYPYVKIDEPTLTMYFSVNNSPFAGKEGKLLTSRQIKERLENELRVNVALRVEPTQSADVFKVSGRGQLHLGILIENMRREGFELQVSAPEVIYKTINGVKHEPIESVIFDIPEEYQGAIMQNIGQRKAELKKMEALDSGRVRLEYDVPSRGLIGLRGQFLTDTRGTGIINFHFKGYEEYKGDIPSRIKGSLVSMENGRVTGYALDTLQDRGILFVKPGDNVYEGQIIGEHSRDNDLDVNPCKEKKLTNMRASGTDEAVKLDPPKIMELETCMEWIRPDELVEVTPGSIRLRKKILSAGMRK